MTLYVYRCPQCPTQVSLAVAHSFGRAGGAVPQCLGAPRAHPSPVWMELAQDTDRAILPLDPPASIGPAKVSTLGAAGILYPATQDALDWLWRHRATNGMAGAFLKVGGRRCIDLVAFARLMREQRA